MLANLQNDAYGEEIKDYYRNRNGGIEIVERDDGYIDYGRVVDVGCGAGRIALYLQEKGHSVLGIDNSPGAIEVCRSRGVNELLNIPFTQIDGRIGMVDCFVLFGNNFGLFGNQRRARWLLRRLKSLSSNNALIIANTTDPYRTDSQDHLAYHAKNRKRGRLGDRLRIRVRYKKIIGPWMEYLLVSKKELEDIVKGTGWAVKQFIDSGSASYFLILEKE